MSNVKDRIVYGIPDVDYLEGAKSLGELLIRQLTRFDKQILLVGA